jgi:hypothetical protein
MSPSREELERFVDVVVMPPLAIDDSLLDRLGGVLYNGVRAIEDG